jgi:hypothetical protein
MLDLQMTGPGPGLVRLSGVNNDDSTDASMRLIVKQIK